ncbi:MAG: response regulator transcription factor [Candidatus Sulfotelmatobacter sp.]
MPARILIADDNPAVRTALRQLLEGLDHPQIIEAKDGKEAIDLALEQRPDAVILDLAMPVMDGLTSAREMSKLLPDLPIVMCTMHWSPQLELEVQKHGVRTVVPKSNASLLLSVMRQFLPAPPPDIPAASSDSSSSESTAVSLPPNPTLPPAEAVSSENSSPADPEPEPSGRAS